MIQEEIQVFKFPSLRRFAQQARPLTQCGRHWTEKATAVDRWMSVFFKVNPWLKRDPPTGRFASGEAPRSLSSQMDKSSSR